MSLMKNLVIELPMAGQFKAVHSANHSASGTASVTLYISLYHSILYCT
jgi:hypothetical protein